MCFALYNPALSSTLHGNRIAYRLTHSSKNFLKKTCDGITDERSTPSGALVTLL